MEFEKRREETLAMAATIPQRCEERVWMVLTIPQRCE